MAEEDSFSSNETLLTPGYNEMLSNPEIEKILLDPNFIKILLGYQQLYNAIYDNGAITHEEANTIFLVIVDEERKLWERIF